MKAMKYLSMVLLMLVTSVCMFSCSDDEDNPVDSPMSIVGSWQREIPNANPVILETMTFNSNRTGTLEFLYTETGRSEIEPFEYDYLEGDGLRRLTIIGSRRGGNYYVSITSSQLVLAKEIDAEEGYIYQRQ